MSILFATAIGGTIRVAPGPTSAATQKGVYLRRLHRVGEIVTYRIRHDVRCQIPNPLRVLGAPEYLEDFRRMQKQEMSLRTTKVRSGQAVVEVTSRPVKTEIDGTFPPELDGKVTAWLNPRSYERFPESFAIQRGWLDEEKIVSLDVQNNLLMNAKLRSGWLPRVFAPMPEIGLALPFPRQKVRIGDQWTIPTPGLTGKMTARWKGVRKEGATTIRVFEVLGQVAFMDGWTDVPDPSIKGQGKRINVWTSGSLWVRGELCLEASTGRTRRGMLHTTLVLHMGSGSERAYTAFLSSTSSLAMTSGRQR